jgi:hypothetical protein
MSPLPGSPFPPGDATTEYWKAVATAAVDLAKAELSSEGRPARSAAEADARAYEALETQAAERQKSEYESDVELHKETLGAYLEVTKGAVQRSRDSADFVQKVAAALATGYTTLLAIVFSIKDNPLPARGFIPTVFLGLAAGLATAYLAFLSRGDRVEAEYPSDLPRENSVNSVRSFVNWTNAIVLKRAPFLRAAVVSLILGIAFLPIAVLTWDVSASSSGATASPMPTSATAAAPSPTPAWPAAPSSPDAAGIELYKAQLQAHTEALAAASPAPTTSNTPAGTDVMDPFAWTLAIFAGMVVAAFAAGALPPTKPDGE